MGYFNTKDGAGSKTLTPDEHRAPHITEAFNLFATGLYTKEQVRARVNALGLLTLKGQPLSAESFDRMLRNPRYAALLSVNGWKVESQGNYEPLVTAETFRRVQDILAGRRTTLTARMRNNPDFPLRNFVCCGHCGKPLTASWSKGKMGVKYAYYRCQNSNCPSPANVRRQDLEDGFQDFLRKQQPDAGYLRLFHKVVLDVWNDKQADATALVRKFEKQMDELRERRTKLNEAFVFQQAITADDYKEMKDALNGEMAA